MAPAYVGNATAFGATQGLDRLVRRAMEEEALAQAAEREANDLELRRRALTNTERATTSNIARDTSAITSDRVMDDLNRARITGANQEAEMGGLRLKVIKGLMGSEDVPGEEFKVPDNTPRGRLNLELIDPGSANAVHGAVRNPLPENLTPEESFYQRAAKDLGLETYHDLSQPDKIRLRKQWMEEGGRDRQFPTMLVPVFNPETQQSTWTPRQDAAGKPVNPPAGQRERMASYDEALAMMDQIDNLIVGMGGKPKGTGPIESVADRAAYKWLGEGLTKKLGFSDDPASEEALRTKISELKALQAFARGGKQFTGTEQKLIDDFVTALDQGDEQLLVRLRGSRESLKRGRRSLGAGEAPGPAQRGGKPPASSDQSPPPDPGAAAYEAYLQRKRGG